MLSNVDKNYPILNERYLNIKYDDKDEFFKHIIEYISSDCYGLYGEYTENFCEYYFNTYALPVCAFNKEHPDYIREKNEDDKKHIYEQYEKEDALREDIINYPSILFNNNYDIISIYMCDGEFKHKLLINMHTQEIDFYR